MPGIQEYQKIRVCLKNAAFEAIVEAAKDEGFAHFHCKECEYHWFDKEEHGCPWCGSADYSKE